MLRIRLAVIVGALALACATGGTSFRVDDSLTLSGNLYRPEGGGPFPAVVLMHGCWGATGFGEVEVEVSRLLRDSGYVSFLVDSFSGRHLSDVCDDSGLKDRLHAEAVDDALAAKRYLSSLAFVDASRIGLVGWADGGITALMTWMFRNTGVPGAAPFAAIAAYYPYCFDIVNVSSAGGPLLILIGESDDWCPAALCKELVANATSRGRDASITIYPGATHVFDESYTAYSKGHRYQSDPAATRDSRKRLLEFFDRTLKK
jgi:dienelactone hydrolase